MELRRLTPDGVRCFSDYLDSLPSGAPRPLPAQALTEPEFSEAVPGTATVQSRSFADQRELAQHLHEDVLAKAELPSPELDAGLWTWLALFWFEDICPRDRSGQFKVGARARWIANVTDYKTYYRHVLAGPYRMFKTYRSDPSVADCLLRGRIAIQSEIVEQLASRQEVVTNGAVIGTATALYVRQPDRTFKRGSKGKGPGSPRRLWEYWNQLDLTWDTHVLTADEFAAMLPAEFDRFKE